MRDKKSATVKREKDRQRERDKKEKELICHLVIKALYISMVLILDGNSE